MSFIFIPSFPSSNKWFVCWTWKSSIGHLWILCHHWYHAFSTYCSGLGKTFPLISIIRNLSTDRFVSKIDLTFCEKKLLKVLWNIFEIRGWRPRICKIFLITRTIYSNSVRSEQFLKQKTFSSYSWRFLRSIRTIKIQFGKHNWDLETCRKS